MRAAWSHIFHPAKSETAGKPFDLEHSLITARDRAAIPQVVYDKVKADGVALEKLGAERFWLALSPLWPADRPHLSVAEIADWFASYVYLPKILRPRRAGGVDPGCHGEAAPDFAYADAFDPERDIPGAAVCQGCARDLVVLSGLGPH